MITFILVAVAALALIAVIWVAATWFIQREPAGHGKHGGRINWDDTPSPRAHLAPGLSIDVLPCMRDGYYPGAPLEPLPPMNLAGWDTQESDGLGDHPAGEPTPNQRQALWQPHVLPSRVIAALENASPEDTAIDAWFADELERAAWETGLADDPWEGCGSPAEWVKALFAGQVQVPA